MDFTSTNPMRRQSDNVGSQDASLVDSAAFERQLSEVTRSPARRPMQLLTHQSGGSASDAQSIMDVSGQQFATASQGVSSEAVPAALPLQPARSSGVLIGCGKRPVHSEDVPLIQEVREALIKGGAAERTAKSNAGHLLSLARWLFENNKGPIAGRLNNSTLTNDVSEFISKGGSKRAPKALDHLRTSQSAGGAAPIAGVADLTLYPEDAALIIEYKNDAATDTARVYAGALRSFGQYLRESCKEGIAARLGDQSLDGDAEDYKATGGNPKIGAALAHLLRSSTGVRTRGHGRHIAAVPDPEGAIFIEPGLVDVAAAQRSASEAAVNWPEILAVEGHEQDLLAGMVDETDPSSPIDRPPQIGVATLQAQRAALAHLKGSACARVIELRHYLNPVPALEEAGLIEPSHAGDIAAQPSALEGSASWSEVIRAGNHEQDLPGRMMDEAGPSSLPEALTQIDVSASEAQRPTRTSGPPYIPPPHGDDGGAMLDPSAQPPSQSTWAFVGRSGDPLYSEDAALIETVRPALIRAGAADRTVTDNVRCLLRWGRWLVKHDKPGIAARIHDKSLDKDAEEFRQCGERAVLTALRHLRASQSAVGIVRISSRVDLNPYPQDAELIKAYKKEARTETARRYATALIDFSHYLRDNNKPGIAARLGHATLDEDAKRYKEAGLGGRQKASAALAHLLASPPGVRAMEVRRHIPPISDLQESFLAQPSRVGDVSAGHDVSEETANWPEILAAQDPENPPLATIDERSFLPSLETTAHHFDIANSGAGDLSLPHDQQWTWDGEMDALDGSALVPVERVFFNHEQDAPDARPAKRQRILEDRQLIAVERQPSEAGSSGRRVLRQVSAARSVAAVPADSPPWSGQSNRILVGRSNSPVYSEDASLVLGLENALIKAGACESTAKGNVGSLLRLGRWLVKNNKPGIAARLNDMTLDRDVAAFDNSRKHMVHTALGHLRASQSAGGIAPFAGRVVLNPYPEDAALIKEYKATELRPSAANYANFLADFSHYLRQNYKPGIAARLGHESLVNDASSYMAVADGHRTIGTALDNLLRSPAGTRMLELTRNSSPNPDVQDAALIKSRRIGNEEAQHSGPEGGMTWPEVLPATGHECDLPLEEIDEPGSSSFEPTARHQQAPGSNESVRLNWPRDSQQADQLPVELDGNNLPPDEEFLINNEHDAGYAYSVMPPPGGDEAFRRDPALQADQSGWGLPGRRGEVLYSEDLPLILGLKEALLKGNAADSTAKANVDRLLSFDRWLFKNNKPGIAARLDDGSLDDDSEEFTRKGGSTNVRTALAHLRTSQSMGGIAPVKGRPDLTAYPEDTALIKEYKSKAATTGNSSTATTYASLLTDFSHYLREHNKPAIAARLYEEAWNEDDSLDEDVKRYKDAGGHRAVGAALDHLRDGARDLVRPPFHPEDMSLISELEDALVKAGYQEITAKTNYARPLRRFSRWLFANNKSGIAARLSDKSLDEDATSFDTGRKRLLLMALDRLRACQQTGGVAPITGLPRAWEAAWQQRAPQGGFNWPKVLPPLGDTPESLLEMADEVGPSSLEPSTRQEPALDFRQSRPLNGGHDGQWSADELMDELHIGDLPPGEELLFNDQHEIEELRPAKSQKMLGHPQGRAVEQQSNEGANSEGGAPTTSLAHQITQRAWAAHGHDYATYRGDASAQHGKQGRVITRPPILPDAHGLNQLEMIEGSPPWSGVVPPAQLQEAERTGQETVRSTSTSSSQMPFNFDWSMWPASEAAPSLSVPAHVSSGSHGGRDNGIPPSAPSDAQIRHLDSTVSSQGRTDFSSEPRAG
ncbi:hypothetical protein [Bradyrhizobium sp. USDA 4504]